MPSCIHYETLGSELSSAVVPSSRIWRTAAGNAGRVDGDASLVEDRVQRNDSEWWCVLPVERCDPVQTDEPVDDCNLCETYWNGSTVCANALLEMSA